MVKREARSHYKIGPQGIMEEKKSFETEADALKMARFLNTKENVIHKMVAYKCVTCGKWHIGGGGKVLTEKDRKEAMEKLNKKVL